jgi:hypothetical protein
MVAALCLSLSGCQMEVTQYGYNVENYSSGSYIVYMSYAGEPGDYLVVPPESEVLQSGGADPVKAIVYDESCLTTLTTVTVSGPWAVIYIDEASHISTSKPKVPLSSAYSPNGRQREPLPVPLACFDLHAEPT